MTPSIKLSGNLGERHRSFNALVQEAYLQKTPLQVQYTRQEAAIDRLFKIELASKQKNVDYIITTLKEDDMLYVSRALKSLWLLDPEYSKIINPGFLEHELFPDMTLIAVNKMRHWIQINLRDPQRCNEFYQFYKDGNFDIAVKFLWHCSNECILGEISGILDKITPKSLKRLSEKVQLVTKVYYDNLKQNEKLLKHYLKIDTKFFENTKYLLKSDPVIFFYILENFFVNGKFNVLSGDMTKYIMKHHRKQFLLKPELYTAWFLDMKTLSTCLNSEDIKDIVLKLAKAEYLQSWFTYKTVEPLLKSLSKDERTTLKKMIFVDKDIGKPVKEWPYPIPCPPKLITTQTSLFDDQQLGDVYIDFEDEERGYGMSLPYKPAETLLDQLFDKYRFCNFKETFSELRNQLRAESSSQNRQFILLVLVSKTGGSLEDLITLLDLLVQHRNEPVHVRATIVRSLVKRAFVWRLPADHWSRLLEWGHGLGLDGSTPEAACNEGLHAVVIRNLLADNKVSQAVWENFLGNFNTLKEYSLNHDERNCISARLPSLLLKDALSDPDKPKLSQLEHLLTTLKAYNMRFDDFPGAVDAIALAVKCYCGSNDDNFRAATEHLLRLLYDAGVARKRLVKEYFEINNTNASYVNAIRHEISILDDTAKLEKLIDGRNLKHDAFFRKLALYFMEMNGLGERYRTVLELRAATASDKVRPKGRREYYEKGQALLGLQMLARPLAMLSGSKFRSLLETLDESPSKTTKRQLASALRANSHLVRPAFDLHSFGWRKVGAKAIANRVSICRESEVEGYLTETLTWRRTLRIALGLAKRVNKEPDVFKVFVPKSPGVALRSALKYFCREGDNSDISVWQIVKTHIHGGKRDYLNRWYMGLMDLVPAAIRAEYCFQIYLKFRIFSRDSEWKALSKIQNNLVDLDEQCISDLFNTFLNDYLPMKKKEIISYYRTDEVDYVFNSYIRVIARFLVLSTTEEMMEKRLHKFGIPFFKRLGLALKQTSSDRTVKMDISLFDHFVSDLKYNKAYFDVKYVSCLPVLQWVTEWMQDILPKEKWFEKYVSVNLTMLYFNAVRYCIEQKPELYTDARKLEGAQMLGTIFGKFVCNKLEEMDRNHFPSIIEIYATDFVSYFSKQFCCRFDESVQNFTKAVLNELIAKKSESSCILARTMFEEFRHRLKDDHVNMILNKFRQSEVQELCFALDDVNEFTNIYYVVT